MQRLNLQVVEASGSNYEIGYKHGISCKEEIRKAYDVLLAEIIEKTGFTKAEVYRTSLKFIPFVETYAPHLLDELRGIRDATELGFEDILVLNLRHEFVYGSRSKQANECTVVGVTKERSAAGETILGQNMDRPKKFMEGMRLFRLKPKGGPSILNYAPVGNVGNQGMNSYGLARVSNALTVKQEGRLGLSRTFLSRLMLEQKSADDVLGLISRVERATSGNYAVADARGDLFDIETTPVDHRLLYPEDGVLLHTNHILHEDMAANDSTVFPDSMNRYREISRMVSNHTGKISTEDIKGWLRDHTGYPESVCNHTYNTTISSLVLQPAIKEMQICYGPPCEGRYETVRL